MGMNIFAIRPGESVVREISEEKLASDIDALEIDDVRDWFCYTKPIGPGVRIVARSAATGAVLFSVNSAGNQRRGAFESRPASTYVLASRGTLPSQDD